MGNQRNDDWDETEQNNDSSEFPSESNQDNEQNSRSEFDNEQLGNHSSQQQDEAPPGTDDHNADVEPAESNIQKPSSDHNNSPIACENVTTEDADNANVGNTTPLCDEAESKE